MITQPPKRTGKPPELVDLTGALVPWLNEQPVLLHCGTPQSVYLPCFDSKDELERAMKFSGIEYDKIVCITDGLEFLDSLPEKYGDDTLIVAAKFRVVDEKTQKFRFVQVFRVGQEAQ